MCMGSNIRLSLSCVSATSAIRQVALPLRLSWDWISLDIRQPVATYFVTKNAGGSDALAHNMQLCCTDRLNRVSFSPTQARR